MVWMRITEFFNNKHDSFILHGKLPIIQWSQSTQQPTTQSMYSNNLFAQGQIISHSLLTVQSQIISNFLLTVQSQTADTVSSTTQHIRNFQSPIILYPIISKERQSHSQMETEAEGGKDHDTDDPTSLPGRRTIQQSSDQHTVCYCLPDTSTTTHRSYRHSERVLC